MSITKELLKNNRVYLNNVESSSNISTLLDGGISTTDTTITVLDTSNFKAKGFLQINNGDEKIYYSSKTTTTFTGCTRGAKGTLSNISSYNDTDPVKQLEENLNEIITSDPQKAGWYIDGLNNQASLRVLDAPVIKPGVIRFYQPEDGSDPVFQGCLTSNSSGPTWQDFNASQGPPGADGTVNATLTFDHVEDTISYDTSNSGLIVKSLTTEIIDSVSNDIYMRKIIPGSREINGVSNTTIDISTTSNTIILNPKPQPYTWNLTKSFNTLKGNPTIDTTLQAHGNKMIAYVKEDETVEKGQVVVLERFTFTGDGEDYLGVKSFTYTTSNELDEYKTSFTDIDLGYLGIALSNISSDSSTLNSVEVLTDGITSIKISTNTPTGFIHNAQILFTGRPCLLSQDGFGFNDQDDNITDNSFQIGRFLETGSTIASDGNYVLVKIDPKFRN
jgi:hypothetical protein